MDSYFIFLGEKLLSQNEIFLLYYIIYNQHFVGFLVTPMLMWSTTSLTDKLTYISKVYHLGIPQFSLSMYQLQIVKHHNKHFARSSNLEEKKDHVAEVNKWKTHSSAVHIRQWSLLFLKNPICISAYFCDTIFWRAMQVFNCHSKDFL